MGERDFIKIAIDILPQNLPQGSITVRKLVFSSTCLAVEREKEQGGEGDQQNPGGGKSLSNCRAAGNRGGDGSGDWLSQHDREREADGTGDERGGYLYRLKFLA